MSNVETNETLLINLQSLSSVIDEINEKLTRAFDRVCCFSEKDGSCDDLFWAIENHVALKVREFNNDTSPLANVYSESKIAYRKLNRLIQDERFDETLFLKTPDFKFLEPACKDNILKLKHWKQGTLDEIASRLEHKVEKNGAILDRLIQIKKKGQHISEHENLTTKTKYSEKISRFLSAYKNRDR